MSILYRARISLVRRPARGTLLAAIMAVLFAALVAAGDIHSTLGEVIGEIRSSTGKVFTASGKITPDLARKIAAIEGVKSYSLYTQIKAKPVGATAVAAGTVRLDGGERISVIGTTASRLHPHFVGRAYSLKSGAHIKGFGRGALVHQSFAKQNSLQTGDRFVLSKDRRVVELTVAGIFVGKSDNNNPLEQAAPENQIFTTLESAFKIQGDKLVDNARYKLDSPKKLPKVLAKARALAPELDYSSKMYQLASLVGAISGVQKLLTLLLGGVCLSGAGILVCTFVFWLRSRLREIGILLALGTTKIKIAAQLAFEIAVTTVVAITVGTIVGLSLTEIVAGTVYKVAGQEGLGGITPKATLVEVLPTVGIGLLVVNVALLVTLLPILKIPTLKILSKTN